MENETANIEDVEDDRDLNPFQIRNIHLLTHLLTNDAITDDVVESLRKNELDYFSLINKYKLLEERVNIDEKTNCLRFKNDYLTEIIKTASRIYFGAKMPHYDVSLVRIDIDDFSIFNNKYGHDIGDDVLIQIAKILKENSRPTDYVIRFGGEEFDIILPATKIEGAVTYIEKIFKSIEKLGIEFNNDILRITVSAGMTSMEYSFGDGVKLKETDIEESFARMQKEADNALYEAKYMGKNRFCIFTETKKDEYKEIRKKYAK